MNQRSFSPSNLSIKIDSPFQLTISTTITIDTDHNKSFCLDKSFETSHMNTIVTPSTVIYKPHIINPAQKYKKQILKEKECIKQNIIYNRENVKRIRLEDRKPRQPYPDSRPHILNNTQYSVCRVPSPSFVRSGPTGECKLTRLRSFVNIRQQTNKSPNYTIQKFVLPPRSKSRSNILYCQNQRVFRQNNTISNFPTLNRSQSKYFCDTLSPLTLPINSIVKQNKTTDFKHELRQLKQTIESPLDPRIELQLCDSLFLPLQSTNYGNYQLSYLKRDLSQNSTVITKQQYSPLKYRSDFFESNIKDSSSLNHSFLKLNKLMQESTSIIKQLNMSLK